MTDRKQALIALRDKVKAGECYPRDVLSVFPHYVGDCGQWAHDAYFHGSLDAAKALRAAVGLPVPEKMHSDARIELLEILEALIEREPGQ